MPVHSEHHRTVIKINSCEVFHIPCQKDTTKKHREIGKWAMGHRLHSKVSNASQKTVGSLQASRDGTDPWELPWLKNRVGVTFIY